MARHKTFPAQGYKASSVKGSITGAVHVLSPHSKSSVYRPKCKGRLAKRYVGVRPKDTPEPGVKPGQLLCNRYKLHQIFLFNDQMLFKGRMETRDEQRRSLGLVWVGNPLNQGTWWGCLPTVLQALNHCNEFSRRHQNNRIESQLKSWLSF